MGGGLLEAAFLALMLTGCGARSSEPPEPDAGAPDSDLADCPDGEGSPSRYLLSAFDGSAAILTVDADGAMTAEELTWTAATIVGDYVLHFEQIGEELRFEARFADSSSLEDLVAIEIPYEYAGTLPVACIGAPNRVYLGHEPVGSILVLDPLAGVVVGEVLIEGAGWSSPVSYDCLAYGGLVHFLVQPDDSSSLEEAPFIVSIDPATDETVPEPIEMAGPQLSLGAATFFETAEGAGYVGGEDGVETIDLAARTSLGLSFSPEVLGFAIEGVVPIPGTSTWYGLSESDSAQLQGLGDAVASAAPPPMQTPGRALLGPDATLLLSGIDFDEPEPATRYQLWNPCSGEVIGTATLPRATFPHLLAE